MNTLTLIPSWLNQPAIHLVVVTTLMLATTGRVFAADSPVDTHGKTATTVVKHTIETILSRIDAEAAQLNGDPEKLAVLVAEVVVPHLDMTRISRMVLGKSWRKADEAQFKRFSAEFQTLLIRTYASSLNQYSGEKIQFPSREKQYKNGTAAVELDIQRPQEPAIGLEFRMHNKLGPWLVYDIKIEGISLVANYRAEFGNIVRSKGIEALITLLENKNRGTRVASNSR